MDQRWQVVPRGRWKALVLNLAVTAGTEQPECLAKKGRAQLFCQAPRQTPLTPSPSCLHHCPSPQELHGLRLRGYSGPHTHLNCLSVGTVQLPSADASD